MGSCFLSIIIPLYNEEHAIPLCYTELTRVFALETRPVEFIFIDDGSTDNSLFVLKTLSKTDTRIRWIQLSRNFGKEAAMSAGLNVATGQYVSQIDVDLQDPPHLIPQMIQMGIQNNWDVVYGVRRTRQGETLLKKLTSYAFYKLIARTSDVPIPQQTGDFRVMTKEVVEALKQLGETQRFMKGLFSWVGFRQGGFLYDRQPRVQGQSKFNYIKLWNFAWQGITSFTNFPLKMATVVGFSLALLAFFLAAFYIVKYFYYGDSIQGFLTLIVAILFIGGIQLIFLGTIGEYLGRLYLESKRRPLYIIRSHHLGDDKDAV